MLAHFANFISALIDFYMYAVLLLQEFETLGARSMAHFTFSKKRVLLVVAQEMGDLVSVMQWDYTSEQFLVIAEHTIRAPTHLVSWVAEQDSEIHGVGGYGFVSVASSTDNVAILRVDSQGNITRVHTLATGPAEALSVFKGHRLKDSVPYSVSPSERERCVMVAIRGHDSSEIHCSHQSSAEMGVGGGRWIRDFIVNTKKSGSLALVTLSGTRYMLSGNGWGSDMEVRCALVYSRDFCCFHPPDPINNLCSLLD